MEQDHTYSLLVEVHQWIMNNWVPRQTFRLTILWGVVVLHMPRVLKGRHADDLMAVTLEEGTQMFQP